ncbi:hypothetical protein [Hyphococcus sp.]|uniref:hypothetical protein n=1 Tax=Hyphococcus sp. TaxID=2038636 RepID=UPI0035C6B585
MRSGAAIRFPGGAIALLLTAMAGANAHASPWARLDGEILVISGVNYFRSDLSSQDPNGGLFESIESDTYFEFGLTDDITIGGKAIYANSSLTNSAGNFNDSGFSEIEAYGQYQFLRTMTHAASVKLSAGKPAAFQSGARNNSGGSGADVELAALYGRNVMYEPVKIFVAAEAGFRKRLGDNADIVRTQGTIGIEPSKHWVLLLETFAAVSMRNEDAAGADYDIVKIKPSVIYRFNRRWAIQAGVTEEVADRNLARGRTYFFSLWSAF